MSTVPPTDSRHNTFHPATEFALGGGGPAPVQDEEPVDPQLIQQTKHQIRTLVNEIAQLAQADVSLDDFYEGFLTRVVAAMASFGGAIWTLDDAGAPQLQYQIHLPQTRVGENKDNETRHRLLLKKILASGESLVVPPHSGTPGDDEAGNPTDYLLILATVELEQRVQAIVEIFQRPGGGPTTQRGYQRFVAQMCDLAADYLKNHRLRHFYDRQQLWEKLETFVRGVHRGLNAQQTSYAIANDGRQLIHCDRVSVALRRGARCEVSVVSGLDTIDRRADEVVRLSDLASAVAAAGRPVWFGRDADSLPPQIEDKIHAYIDRSHAKLIGILPLYAPPQSSPREERHKQKNAPHDEGRGELLGALIVESLTDDRIAESMRHRAESVAEHSSSALANAVEHESLFLLPLWRTLGKARVIVQARQLPKTILVTAAIVGSLLALWLVPAELEIASRGKLQPAERHEVFALTDGVVTDVPVRHGQVIEDGGVLAQLRSDELENELLALLERQSTTKEQVAAKQSALIGMKGQDIAAEHQLAGELAQLLQSAESIETQLALVRKKQSLLTVRAEGRCQVLTWHIHEQLLKRPVTRGQSLMSVANPDGAWELELYMPQGNMGHVMEASAAYLGGTSDLFRPGDKGLPVTFLLSTHPDREFVGRVVEIHRTAEVRGEDGNTVLLRVSLDKEKLPELHSETTVQARVHCGQRSIGFVWFRDLIETVQRKWLDWF